MKLQLGRRASNIFVAIYLLITLYIRFSIEAQLNGNLLVSVGLGAFALLFLWAMTNSGYINPSFFGQEDKPVESLANKS
jgi:hypothetical protein